MSLETEIMVLLKEAMKAKDEASLRGIRAIKAEIIKAKTEPGAGGQITEEGELKLLQKLVKQRKDSLEIFTQQNRTDLAQKEQEEIDIIEMDRDEMESTRFKDFKTIISCCLTLKVGIYIRLLSI